MAPLEDEVKTLSQWMEQEIATYHLLIEELKKEADCLRTGAIDPLLKVVKVIERYTEALHRLQTSIQISIGRVFAALELDPKETTLPCLLAHLPPVPRAKMRSYQQRLRQLQEWVRQINDKNKAFIREHLTVLAEVTALLINPEVETPCYPRTGHSCSPAPAPYALSREV
jgi:hypothetical protein